MRVSLQICTRQWLALRGSLPAEFHYPAPGFPQTPTRGSQLRARAFSLLGSCPSPLPLPQTHRQHGMPAWLLRTARLASWIATRAFLIVGPNTFEFHSIVIKEELVLFEKGALCDIWMSFSITTLWKWSVSCRVYERETGIREGW